MIHNRFFTPYPLQAVLNSIRQYAKCDTIVIKRLMTMVNFKNNLVGVTLFECDSFFEGNATPLIIIKYHNKILFCAGKLTKLFGDRFYFSAGRTIDMDGNAVNLSRLVPRIIRLSPSGAQFLAIPVGPLNPKHTVQRMNDFEFTSLIVTRPTIGWQYEINLNQHTAFHVISIAEEKRMDTSNDKAV